MLASSWKATGLVRQAWLKLDVPKGHREELAARTGIPAPNLSRMNTGKLPMTRNSAQRIVDAVPGLTFRDLGEPADTGESLFVTSLLGQIVAELGRNPPRDPSLLQQLATELRGLASDLEEAAKGRDGASLP